MNIREAMEKKGANKAQLESRTVEMIEEIIAENEGVVSSTASCYKQTLEANLKRYNSAVSLLAREIDRLESKSKELRGEFSKTQADVSKAVSQYEQKIIEDSRMKDALIMYSHMLGITKEVFGEENMTESVMMQAIEAGSYAIWRGIMGPKIGDDDQKKANRRW